MNLRERLPMILVVSVLAAGGFLVAQEFMSSPSNGAHIAIKVPEFSALALKGKKAFDANCGACHGKNAAGTDKGPPLVHNIYNPGHHGDQAFYLAAKRGTPQHHWPYGNMPPQPQVTERQIAAIVQYVREMQRANGIFYREHRM